MRLPLDRLLAGLRTLNPKVVTVGVADIGKQAADTLEAVRRWRDAACQLGDIGPDYLNGDTYRNGSKRDDERDAWDDLDEILL